MAKATLLGWASVSSSVKGENRIPTSFGAMMV